MTGPLPREMKEFMGKGKGKNKLMTWEDNMGPKKKNSESHIWKKIRPPEPKLRKRNLNSTKKKKL